jgi:hypothetical protein
MAVKKGILDNFLKPTRSLYSDNQKDFRTIFIDKNEDDFKPEPKGFAESHILDLAQDKIHLNPSSHDSSDQLSSAKTGFNPNVAISEILKKPNTNLTQTQHSVNKQTLVLPETKHKVNTNRTHKLDTNPTQTNHESSKTVYNFSETKHKVNTKVNTAKTQTKHKVHTNLTQTTQISKLSNLQRSLLLFIFEECKKARSHTTEPLTISFISSETNIVAGSIKTSLVRLCSHGFLSVNDFKNGRGGWTAYEIPDAVYKDLLQLESRHKLHTNITQTKHKPNTQPHTQPDTTSPSSSSFNIINTTTSLPEEWLFDITPYSAFGFTQTQLKQLAHLGVITPLQVEESLIQFKYDLDNGALPKIKTSSLNFFMGLLRGGNSYVSEGHRSTQKALTEEMARRAKAKEKSLSEAKFIVWISALTDDEKNALEKKLPTSYIAIFRSHGIQNQEVKEWLFNYYVNIKTF